MTAYVGGTRKRLIKESVFRMLLHRLGLLGWFDTIGRQHQPINFAADPQPLNEQIVINTLALSAENTTEEDVELGGALAEFRWQMYVDFFGEDDSLGIDIIGDVAAILSGRMASIGAGRPVVPVFDFLQATPTSLFVVQVENVRTDKAHDWPHPWLRHWHSCQFEIVDEYANEDSEDFSLAAPYTWADLF